MRTSEALAIAEGQIIPPYRVQITKLRMMMYQAATWNPYRLHWDTEWCKENGFPDANVAGPMVGDYLTEMLIRWAGAARLKILEYANRSMSFPGDTLICNGKVRRIYEEPKGRFADCQVWAENQEGRLLAEGSALISVF